MLIKRRNKIASIYLTAVNPIVNPRLERNRLTFENAAVAAGVAKGPAAYRASWLLFDNATGATQAARQRRESATTTIEAPSGLPTAPAASSRSISRPTDAAYPTWKQPVRTLLPPDGGGLEAGRAGADARQPAAATTAPAQKTKS